MKKLAICCLAIAVAAMFAPAAQAQSCPGKCYHLTNFCDGLQVTNVPVGGIARVITNGLWDWVCLANGTGTLVSGVPNKFGTQPLYPYSGGPGAGFDATFVFNNTSHLFDLYGTFDGCTSFAFQTNQPFTTTKGACTPLARKNGMRRATTR